MSVRASVFSSLSSLIVTWFCGVSLIVSDHLSEPLGACKIVKPCFKSSNLLSRTPVCSHDSCNIYTLNLPVTTWWTRGLTESLLNLKRTSQAELRSFVLTYLHANEGQVACVCHLIVHGKCFLYFQ